ncbi:hypothetical protein BBO99_00005325 [Phytophthora kernoviae]|uniref:Zinc/iron permease n=2 Tax=Phytophthora kernoviae TaxID=325452 RepID=A0A3R7IKV7_9STRA|nr:hypothetical protein G195_008926 [Phytophthora kernoviae 00238/432]KAG2517266.1 hypothetical protein JM16_007473 [Phytophthora kernoviae]KAG2519844.1 hypothetical protein JM18_007428 [Phytophthora kernoviae]RLN27411.1 hypothetical protein BBI17_005473 [Phytophthora kernoviae]RLN79354.1 hypothetical protein BBO99_00005325 [Phytophthora kernoviae]
MQDTGLHIGAIFIIFAVSAAGTQVPVISKKIPLCRSNSIVMEAISAFSYGVVIATGLIHMVNEGIEKLSDEALGSIVEDYGSLGLAFVLITLVVMHLIEYNSYQVMVPNASQDSKIRRKIATVIFEAGVIFHSIIVGIDLGVTEGSKFKTLLIALCFHQFFEGVAIGTAALGSIQTRAKLFLVNLAFAITTPIGQVIGLSIRNSYSDSSATSLWVQGVLDCVAGGILLYTGLVELLTYNMTTNQQFLSRSAPQRFTLYFCLWMGAALMALIGKWS